MAFIGYTAAIDAILVLIALFTISMRRSKVETGASSSTHTMIGYLQTYLIFNCLFLILISLAMLGVTGTTQGVVLLLADLALWISLAYMIMIGFVSSSSNSKTLTLAALLIPAGLASLLQILKLAGVLIDLGSIAWIFDNMAPIL